MEPAVLSISDIPIPELTVRGKLRFSAALRFARSRSPIRGCARACFGLTASASSILVRPRSLPPLALAHGSLGLNFDALSDPAKDCVSDQIQERPVSDK